MTKNSIDVSVCSSTSTTATGSAYCSGYIFAQNVWILRVSEWWRTNAIYSEERAIYNESHWQLVLLLDTFVWLWLAYYNKFVVSLSPFVYLTFRSSLAFFHVNCFFSFFFFRFALANTFDSRDLQTPTTIQSMYYVHIIYKTWHICNSRARNIDVTIFYRRTQREKKNYLLILCCCLALPAAAFNSINKIWLCHTNILTKFAISHYDPVFVCLVCITL